MALRIGKLCGNGPTLWLNLQQRYDLAKALVEMANALAGIPTLELAR